MSVVKFGPEGEDVNMAHDYIAYRNQSQTLRPVAAYNAGGYSLMDSSAPERVGSARVSPEFFPVLGGGPVLGRLFSSDEYQPSKGHVVVLSYRLWQRRYGGNPGLIGKTITLDHEPYTVIGVMPQEFQLPKDCDVWSPLAVDDESLASGGMRIGLEVIARLKPGVTPQQAQEEINGVAQKLEKDFPETNKGASVKLTALRESAPQNLKVLRLELRLPPK